jgi:hypothetical protein
MPRADENAGSARNIPERHSFHICGINSHPFGTDGRRNAERKADIMSAVKAVTATKTRKTFDVRPSQGSVDVDKLIATAMKRFPKVHAILAK